MALNKYLIRRSCEYSIVVEAINEDMALTLANATELHNWDQAWSHDEVEKAVKGHGNDTKASTELG